MANLSPLPVGRARSPTASFSTSPTGNRVVLSPTNGSKIDRKVKSPTAATTKFGPSPTGASRLSSMPMTLARTDLSGTESGVESRQQQSGAESGSASKMPKKSPTLMFKQDESTHEDFIQRSNARLHTDYAGQSGPNYRSRALSNDLAAAPRPVRKRPQPLVDETLGVRSDSKMFTSDELSHAEFIRKTNEHLKSTYLGSAGPQMRNSRWTNQVSLQSLHGKFIIAQEADGQLVATSDVKSLSATFAMTYHADGAGSVSLKNVRNGKYVIEEGERLIANATTGPGEKFILTTHEDGNISLKTARGKYVFAQADGRVLSSQSQPSAQARFRKVDIAWNPSITLQGHNGKFITAQTDGQLLASSDSASSSARFQVKYHTDGSSTVSLQNMKTGKYIVEEGGRCFAKDPTGTAVKCLFMMTAHEDGTISLKSSNGKYIGANADGHLVCNLPEASIVARFRKVEMHAANNTSPRARGETDDSRGSDGGRSRTGTGSDSMASGLSMSTSPTGSTGMPLSLSNVALQAFGDKFVVASEADGRLFASSSSMSMLARFQIKYHQIANGTGSVSFRHVMNGKYVVEENGSFFAKAVASPGEKFAMTLQDDGSIALQTASGKYFAVQRDGHIGSQAEIAKVGRFCKVDIPWAPTIALQSDRGKFVVAREMDGELLAVSGSISLLARFEIVHDVDGSGNISLRSLMSGKYVVEQGGRFVASDFSGPGEKFTMSTHEDGTISLKSASGKSVAVDADGHVKANKSIAAKFSKVDVPSNPNVPATDDTLGLSALNSPHSLQSPLSPMKTRMNEKLKRPDAAMLTQDQRNHAAFMQRTNADLERMGTWSSGGTSASLTPRNMTPKSMSSNNFSTPRVQPIKDTAIKDADDLFFRKPQPKRPGAVCLFFSLVCCAEEKEPIPHPRMTLPEELPHCLIQSDAPVATFWNNGVRQLGHWAEELFGARSYG